jgi:drug/metabolite transporter (DMT)-like permease
VDRRTWAAFGALAGIWGSSFLFIKVAVVEVHPAYVALGRMGCGAATLLVILVVMRHRLPRGPRLWGHLSVAALAMNTVPFTLFAYGEQYVSSILAGMLNATTPLFTLVVAAMMLPQERATRRAVLGLLLGFGGVLLLLGVWQGFGGPTLLGSLACLVAAACYGVGGPYTRRFLVGGGESVYALSAAQLLAGTAQLAVVAPQLAGAPRPPSATAGAALLALGVLGTGVAYLLFYRVVQRATATTMSTVTYLLPVVATVAGVLVLDERLAWYQLAGALVVLGGVALVQSRPAAAPGGPAGEPVGRAAGAAVGRAAGEASAGAGPAEAAGAVAGARP